MDKLLEHFGTQTALANFLNIKTGHVYYWIRNGIPPKRAIHSNPLASSATRSNFHDVGIGCFIPLIKLWKLKKWPQQRQVWTFWSKPGTLVCTKSLAENCFTRANFDFYHSLSELLVIQAKQIGINCGLAQSKELKFKIRSSRTVILY